MATLSEILGKGGLTIDQSGTASAPGTMAPTTLQQLSPAVQDAVSANGATLNLKDEVVASPTKPVYGPPTPPAFTADVPSTMDATQVAGAVTEPVTLPTIPEQKPFLMADGRYYNPTTGVSGATMDEAMGTGPSASGPVPPSGPTETPGPSGKAPVMEDDVTQTIKTLFPESDSLVKQYQGLRKSSGLDAAEADLAKANQEAADMQAVIDGIEDEVRAQAGGMADASFIAATVADRIRRLMPQINRINARVTALTSTVENKKANVTEQLGFSQQDIANARQRRLDIRQGINDMFDSFGSAAFANTDPAVLTEIEKQAGLPPGSLSAKAKTLEEKKMAQKSYDFQVAGNKLFKMDRTTGEVVDTGVVVPDKQKSAFEEAIAIAGALKDVSDPDQVLEFITSYSGGAPVDTTKKVNALSDEEVGNVIVAMAKREGFGADPNNRPTRNNNPLNVKLGAATKHWVDEGLATVEKTPAADGGNFLVFKDAETGLKAAEELFRSDIYSGLSLDAALKKWSGNGYGAEIVEGQVGTLGGAFSKTGAVPKLSTAAPADLLLVANRVVSNPKLDEKDRAAFAKNFNSLIEKGDVKSALAAAKQTALLALPAGQQDEYREYTTKGKIIQNLLGGINSFSQVNPNLYKTILEKGKTLAAASKDPDWLRLISNVERIQTEIRKELFGTAVSSREAASGDSLFINTKTDTLQDMQVKLNTLLSMANQNASSVLDYALGLL